MRVAKRVDPIDEVLPLLVGGEDHALLLGVLALPADVEAHVWEERCLLC